MSAELTAERLRELIDYDPDTGLIARRTTKRGQTKKPGQWFRGTKSGGYRRITVDGKLTAIHRLAWLHTHGEWPVGGLDHINGNGHDNRISNLREATTAQNNQNRAAPLKTNTSGHLGVHWDKRHKRWMAQISVDGHHQALGSYKTIEEASVAYWTAKERLHGGEEWYGERLVPVPKLAPVPRWVAQPAMPKVAKERTKVVHEYGEVVVRSNGTRQVFVGDDPIWAKSSQWVKAEFFELHAERAGALLDCVGCGRELPWSEFRTVPRSGDYSDLSHARDRLAGCDGCAQVLTLVARMLNQSGPWSAVPQATAVAVTALCDWLIAVKDAGGGDLTMRGTLQTEVSGSGLPEPGAAGRSGQGREEPSLSTYGPVR